MYKKISKDSSARYYQNNKRRLQKNAHERFQDVSEKKKNKKQEYGPEWYKKISKKMVANDIKISKNIVANDIKISKKIKNKGLMFSC